MVKFHYVTLALETNSIVESETVIKLNQAKYAMAFLNSDDTHLIPIAISLPWPNQTPP
jgi:hypothetical protein